MNNLFYGIGVGPGDQSLLTLKAINTIVYCDVLIIPQTEKNKIAYNIISEYITNQELIFVEFVMSNDKTNVNQTYLECACIVEGRLDKGLNVGFITIGDPSIYSTYSYVAKIVLEDGYHTKMIPGITSFCASAAASNVMLCEKDQALHIFSPAYDINKELLKLTGTKILMKSSRYLEDILKEDDEYYIVERCGFEDQCITSNINNLDHKLNYLSTTILKGNK